MRTLRQKRRSTYFPVIALSLMLAASMGTAGCAGCPTALLSGELVAKDGELAVSTGNGDVRMVKWPLEYGVRTDDGTLVLTRFMVSVVAREGDQVALGGGMIDDKRFGVCGQVDVRRAA
jgi:hypothetical protein